MLIPCLYDDMSKHHEQYKKLSGFFSKLEYKYRILGMMDQDDEIAWQVKTQGLLEIRYELAWKALLAWEPLISPPRGLISSYIIHVSERWIKCTP